MAPFLVVAAAIVQDGRLLVVSKKAAPDVFYLPGGKPEPGESPRQTLIRELDEELGVLPAQVMLLGEVDELSALERVPMRMTVFTARLVQVPRPAAELAALAWTTGTDAYEPLLAPALTRHVIPCSAPQACSASSRRPACRSLKMSAGWVKLEQRSKDLILPNGPA